MSSELSAGSVFAERYRIERQLAAGGMGAVYEVVHLETNRHRALKVLHTKFMQNDTLRNRFRQEARVVAQIDSEYIVDVFDAGIDTATEMPFLVMELLRGEDVRARVRRDGPLPSEEAVRYLYEACLALEKMHQAHVIHRDLKPDNMFLCEREHGPPRIKVLDFGIAKILSDGSLAGQGTQSLGTPLYMAPEQYAMSGAVSPATDIYALGLIAYTMLAGKPYWAAESRSAGSPIAFAIHAAKGPKESPVARAARRGVKLPREFDAWFFRATAEKQADRFQSAMDAVTELASTLGVPLPETRRRTSVSGPISLGPLNLKAPSSELLPEPTPVTVPEHSAAIPSSAPSSASPLALPTPTDNAQSTAPAKSIRYRLVSAAGVLATVMAGSLVDTMLYELPAGEPTSSSAAGSNISNAIAADKPIATVAPPEPTEETVPIASSSPASPPAETSATQPASSATTTGTPPTTGKTGRPNATVKKPSRVIWNND